MITFPILSSDDYKEAREATDTTSRFAEFDAIQKVTLGNLVSQHKYTGGGQLSRNKQINPNKITRMAQSFLENGWVASEPLMIATPHPRNKDKYVIVEGNHRLAALRKIAADQEMSENNCKVAVLIARPAKGYTLETMLSSTGSAANSDKLPSEPMQVSDYVSTGKTALLEGVFDHAGDDMNAKEKAVRSYLIEDLKMNKTHDNIGITKAVKKILDDGVYHESYIMWNEEIVKSLLSATDVIGSSGTFDKGARRYTSPIFQTARTAINNWQSFVSSEETCRFFLWDADDSVEDCYNHYLDYFDTFYVSYEQVYDRLAKWHTVSKPKLTPAQLFAKAEFWIARQMRTQKSGPTRDGVIKFMHNGEEYHAIKLDVDKCVEYYQAKQDKKK